MHQYVRSIIAALLLNACSHDASTTQISSEPRLLSPLARSYRVGEEIIAYRMNAANQQGGRREIYEAISEATVRQSTDGIAFEETRWKSLQLNGTNVPLSPAAQNFRQEVSLDLRFAADAHMPSVGAAEPYLAGPIFDLMNFYVDLQLAAKITTLQKQGDHAYIKYSQPSSYADPTHGVIIGAVCIDFDLTLKELDEATQTATVVVKHVPPPIACVDLAAPWMQTQVVAGFANNHVQVNKNADGTFTVAVGKEDIDVEIKIQMGSGKILSATMYNPVEISERICADDAYLECGSAESYRVLREIKMTPIQQH